MKPIQSALALAGALLILSACDSEQTASIARAEQATPVETATAVNRDVSRRVDAVGTLYGSESVTITAKVTEQVNAVYFEGGEQVQRGQVLAELMSAEQAAMLSEARANLRETQLQYDRLVNLGKDIATAAEIDVARARVDASEARLAAIESQLADRQIQAPFTGIIGFRRISVGALVTPGTVIAELDSVQPLKLDFTLPEVFFAQVNVGDAVDAHSAAWPDQAFPGVISRIGSRIDPVTRTFEVRVLLPNEALKLRPGMLMNVSVGAGRHQRIVIPESALMQSGDRSTVFVLNDAGRADRRSIILGRRLPGFIVVEDGLAAGEQVIVKGQMLLRPGALVEVVKEHTVPAGEGADRAMMLPVVSVRRPVFASVIALLLISFGVMAFLQLSTREYPDIAPPQVSVNTMYEGAAADVIEKRITQPLEDEIGGIEGIRSIRSSSSDGRSSITVEFELSRDIDSAANDVRDRVARASRRLPEEAERPQVTKADSAASPLVYISLEASNLSMMDITDYAERYIVDRFAVLPGVASVNLYGGAQRSMRIWLDRDKLSARALTVSDITDALRRENLELPAGRLESVEREFPVRVARGYRTAEDFKRLVIASAANGHLVRLGEVARVEEGASTTRRIFLTNGQDSMSMGVVKQSNANTVEVLDAVHHEIEAIRADLPEGMGIASSGDASAFIRAAINGVYSAIGMTIGLVSLVILLFLGTFRATLIPVVCIPISLFGALIALQALGYSINLITLLAMVLAIGLVVDDAIVVLENIYRRIEDGEPPLLAAARGAQQVGFAVIATTAVLLAVFSPVLFLQDATAKLFVELAATIAAGVVVSSVMALSLVPMMCSQLLSATKRPSVLTTIMEALMSAMRRGYETSLRWLLPRSWLALPLIIGAVAAIVPVFDSLEREYVPIEDQDAVLARVMAPEGTNIPGMREIIETLQPPLLERYEEGTLTRVLFVSPFFNATAPTEAFLRVSMVPQDERDYSAFELRADMLKAWQGIPGIRAMAFLPGGLGQRGPNTPVQFVLQGPDYEQLAQWRDIVMERASETGMFGVLTSDLKETQQQIHVAINATRAAALDVTTREVAEALQVLMTEQEVTTFSADGEEYAVIVQLEDYQRMTPSDIENVQVRGANGQLVPLSNLLTTESRAGIADLNRYNRLRAVTISGSPAEGVSLGDALAVLEDIVARELPAVAKVAYKGQSEDYKESGNDISFALGLALLVLFLVMAAQFESFIHPAVIMVTVPLALLGGLVGLLVTGETFNLFSQIGLLMLIGIATKNGILLVEFINQVRDEGVPFDDAIVQASGLRLRPVLMTTLSTLIGAVPLVLMTGPGAASRNVLGVVVLFGVSLATVFTLYLVPAVYRLLARNTSSPEAIAHEMARLESDQVS